jgi:hypothetical protein
VGCMFGMAAMASKTLSLLSVRFNTLRCIERLYPRPWTDRALSPHASTLERVFSNVPRMRVCASSRYLNNPPDSCKHLEVFDDTALGSYHLTSIARPFKMPRDLVNRGARGQAASTPLGTSIFVGLRALDPILQRLILQANPLANLHSQISLRTGAPSGGDLIRTGGLGLTPFQAVIWTMSVGSAVKQIYWILVTAKEPMYTDGAVIISFFNTLNNSLNTLLFTVAASNPTWSPLSLYVGAALYTIGILVEPISETQRKIFKDNPENKGKPFSGGLFGLARNINYGAYTLWRGGMALAAGGPIWVSFLVSRVKSFFSLLISSDCSVSLSLLFPTEVAVFGYWCPFLHLCSNMCSSPSDTSSQINLGWIGCSSVLLRLLK